PPVVYTLSLHDALPIFRGISTAGRNNGCAYTAPSTSNAPSFPNCFSFTFCGVRDFSSSVAPVRKLSYCEVATCAAPALAPSAKVTTAHSILSRFICRDVLQVGSLPPPLPSIGRLDLE